MKLMEDEMHQKEVAAQQREAAIHEQMKVQQQAHNEQMQRLMEMMRPQHQYTAQLMDTSFMSLLTSNAPFIPHP